MNGCEKMNINELIEKLEEIKEEKGEDIVCCTYDSVLEDYTENLCPETVDDDYYLNKNNEKIDGKTILLF